MCKHFFTIDHSLIFILRRILKPIFENNSETTGRVKNNIIATAENGKRKYNEKLIQTLLSSQKKKIERTLEYRVL